MKARICCSLLALLFVCSTEAETEIEVESLDLRPTAARELRSATSSGYLNLRATQNRIDQGIGADVLTPLDAQLEFVQQYRGFVFEASGLYQERAADLWTRQDLRLVHDREDSMVRWILGDLPSRALGFQSQTRMGGLSLRREFSIRPERTALRLSGYELVLKRDSLVQFWVNGALFSQVRLPAGRFNLREFPLLTGLNAVEVRVRDDLGQEERFDFDLLFDAGLLEAGVHEFFYDLGYPWQLVAGDRVYDTSAVFSSISHRFGLSRAWTIGFNFQNWYYRSLAGMELTQGTKWGLLSFDGALSHILGVTGGAGRMRWRSPDRLAGLDPSWRLGAEFLRRADSFFQVTPDPLVASDVEERSELQISKRLGVTAVLGLALFEEKAFFLGTDRRGGRVNLALPLTGFWRTELFYQRTEGGTQDEQAGIMLSWSDFSGRMTANASHEGPRNANTVLVHRTNAQAVDDHRWTLAASQEQGVNTAGVSGEYLAAPAALRLEHLSGQTSAVNASATAIGLDSALVWADGDFALSRPVMDAFVMIRQSESADRGARSVLQEIGSYSAYELRLKDETLRVRPGYRSGVLVREEVKGVSVRGLLARLDGVPWALLGGELRDAEGNILDSGFFTNREGGFLVEVPGPGSYRVIFADEIGADWEFQVSAESAEVDLGKVHLSADGKIGEGR